MIKHIFVMFYIHKLNYVSKDIFYYVRNIWLHVLFYFYINGAWKKINQVGYFSYFEEPLLKERHSRILFRNLKMFYLMFKLKGRGLLQEFTTVECRLKFSFNDPEIDVWKIHFYIRSWKKIVSKTFVEKYIWYF